MSQASDQDLKRLLYWVLGSGTPPPRHPERIRFLDSSAVPALSLAHYHHAVDQREVSVLHRCRRDGEFVVLALVRGRHVGSLGVVVPSGRHFETFVHVRASPHAALVYGSLPSALLHDGVSCFGAGYASWAAQGPADASNDDLRSANVEATRWARAWSLPPRLARLCILLIAGWRPARIAAECGLTLRTVRTYSEHLFRAAGVSSRAELPVAALRASQEHSEHASEEATEAERASSREVDLAQLGRGQLKRGKQRRH